MAIFKDITPAAVDKLISMAQFEGVRTDIMYVQVDDKPVGPWKMFWIITFQLSYDPNKYYVENLRGLRFTIEKEASVFLQGVTIDFDEAEIAKPFYPKVASPAPRDRPVLPKGFLFNNQKIYPEYQLS